LIEKEAQQVTAPDGSVFRGLPLTTVERLSRETGTSRKQVEITALKAAVIPLRYQRNIGSIGTAGQVKLLESCAVVVGAGGLGGLTAELLARVGVGRITVVDPDAFTEDNLNRQIVETEQLLGRNKAQETARRLREVNAAIEVQAHAQLLGPENAGALLAGARVVVDGLDSITARLTLQAAAAAAGVPLVSAAVAGFMGYVTTIMPGDLGWKAFYHSESIPEAGVERELGTLSATPALAAALEVQEVVKLITGKGKVLQNRFLFFDTENNTFSLIELKGQDS
jgi:molybdopterin/thiamine biosynthesis adenylyltransferase